MKNCAAVLVVVLFGNLSVHGQTDTSPHTEHFVQVNGTKLHYLDWGGKGEPLVFLTGNGSVPHVFDSVAVQFTQTNRVVALTRRGRAPSDTPASGYDHATLTSDVRGVLDALGFGRVHLVAHSFGGSEATRLAIDYPDRVASVVYLDAALDAAAGEAVLKEAPVSNPQPPPGSPYAQVLQWWTSYTPDFSKVRCPTLAFYAVQENPPIPPDASADLRQRAVTHWQTRWLPMLRHTIDKFRREASRGRVVVFDNASHYFFREREADTVREMKAFYASMRVQATASSATRSFEAASIKPNTSGDLRMIMRPAGARFTATNVPLRALIGMAFGLQDFQLEGGPAWTRSDRFDITATAQGNPSRDVLLAMLRTLLSERFKLTTRTETREKARYLLTLARKDRRLGPRLRSAAADCSATPSPGGPPCGFIGPAPRPPGASSPAPMHVAFRGTTMDAFARFLIAVMQRNVVNDTGLSGYFDGDFDWSIEFRPPPPPPGLPNPFVGQTFVSIFTVLQEQLGLKLEPGRGPVEVLVIDHVERPTPD